MEKALLLVDIQNDYFQGGRNPLVNPFQAAEQAGLAINYFRSHQLPIFHVQHISLQEGATFFLPNTEGCNIHESVGPREGETVIVKHTPDSFFQTNLQEQLTAIGVKQLFICGMMSHMCIDTTVRVAKRLGYTVVVIEDACTTKDLVWGGEVIPAATVNKTFMVSLKGTFAEIIQQRDISNIAADDRNA